MRLIGDLPFFVSPDSSDVWANPELFLLGKDYHPTVVAGVPPDYFSADGQLWGNPVYDWDALRQSGYRWCVDRLRALLAQVDVIRLDHFRAFAAAWHVPAGASTAQAGQWVRGPGAEFFEAVEKGLGALPFIAEDLGLITPDVTALRDRFRLPGMRVLQFAFDGNADNPYLPHNYVPNTVVYTGTHDNPTTRGWYEELSDKQQQHVWSYLGRSGGAASEVAPALMHLAWESVAALAIAPLQDLLNLGNEARMNVPGRADGQLALALHGGDAVHPRVRMAARPDEHVGPLARRIPMMNHDTETTARTLVADGKGILAADETPGTLTKRFDALGIRSTEQSRRTYRELLFTAPDAATSISGVIMQDETIRQKSSTGTPLAQVLASQGIVPGIKVDTGAKPLALAPGETITEGLDGLRDRLAEYRGMGARFAKWRAVIHIADGLPSRACVSANAHALARYAALCQEGGLVPIVEPEVLMDGSHSIEHCEEVTSIVLHAVFEALFEQRVVARVHAAQAQHGRPGQGELASRVRAGGRDGDAALPAPDRAGGGARHRVPVGRSERAAGHRPSERDQSAARAQALEAQLLLRARTSRFRAGGVARAGREPENRPGGPVAPGPVQRRRQSRPIHR